uniref:NADH-ubiquinone oxidoreductase chain 5 n=1 Tax=Ornithodoros hermsi TaxID=303297 RepID=A0A3G2K017_9ACAR|nr:NADH dehydrogenase subunit 5 [Ornithodoros hermsi]AYN50644.1 NADH dehydrogenase subunit 5 [Ornithodoros hermsi]
MYFKWGFVLLMVSFFMLLIGGWFLFTMKIYLIDYYLMVFGNFELKFFFLFDWMSVMFTGVVLGISGSVILYSYDYMHNEKLKIYFCWGVLLFVGSMFLMILSPNLLMIMLGWDGLGLVSYCLVIFYQNYSSNSAGMITIMSNRIGDVMILLSVVFVLNFGSLDFFLFSKTFMISGFFLIVAGMTKSAQIPFSAWLPAAMAAPTPVSSLVHSSTLVTAGVYLLIRLDLLFTIEEFKSFLLYFSLLTMLMSGIGAVLEMDLKKIIALSTLSQLGMMMVSLSLGMTELAFFHLLTHAVFKAMLFLCAGFMIHKSLGSQDIRFMGIFFFNNPFLSVAFSLANMSLFGIPFLSGFFSKDLILEYIYMKEGSWFVIYVVVVSTICTCVYSLRVMYYTMWGGEIKSADSVFQSLMWMETSIFFLGLMVILFGASMSWVLFPNFDLCVVKLKVKLINMVIIMMGVWCFYLLYPWKINFMGKGVAVDFLKSMWFLSTCTGSLTVSGLMSGFFFYRGDNGWVEEIGPQGINSFSVIFSSAIHWLQVNQFSNYIFFSLLFLILFF